MMENIGKTKTENEYDPTIYTLTLLSNSEVLGGYSHDWPKAQKIGGLIA